MLRKRLSSFKPRPDETHKKRKSKDKTVNIPIGSEKPKADTEKELESLVLGGEHQIIDVLVKSEKVQ